MSLKKGLSQLTEQLLTLLQSISTANYQSPLPILDGSTIGQHVRHIIDFYTCLEAGLQSGTVDYARRNRAPEVETHPGTAYQTLNAALQQLLALPEDTPLMMRGDFYGVEEAQRPCFPSSLGRELTFVHDHAVHHLAIIKIGLASCCPETVAQPNFGVAPSTVKHRASQTH